jgi:hypothetical protein
MSETGVILEVQGPGCNGTNRHWLVSLCYPVRRDCRQCGTRRVLEAQEVVPDLRNKLTEVETGRRG